MADRNKLKLCRMRHGRERETSHYFLNTRELRRETGRAHLFLFIEEIEPKADPYVPWPLSLRFRVKASGEDDMLWNSMNFSTLAIIIRNWSEKGSETTEVQQRNLSRERGNKRRGESFREIKRTTAKFWL